MNHTPEEEAALRECFEAGLDPRKDWFSLPESARQAFRKHMLVLRRLFPYPDPGFEVKVNAEIDAKRKSHVGPMSNEQMLKIIHDALDKYDPKRK